MNNLLCCHGHAVPAPVEIVTVTTTLSFEMNTITAEWKVTMLVYNYVQFNINVKYNGYFMHLQENHTLSAWSVSIPPASHYIVYHNVTSDGNQGIIAYDTSVTINVGSDLFEANAVYSIRVVAVNVIGQGPVSETIFSE